MEYQETLKGQMLNGLIDHSRTTPEGLLINVKVKTNAKRFWLRQDGVLEVKASPEHGKANAEIVKKLKKLLGCEVRILMGLTSKNKMILLKGMDTERLNRLLREK